ncbi:MAG: hypothetical protein GEU94_15710 [Micromonosporaceae bacterium]|nr:hypothetical protein [Micromonosporaceae bacterium]
MRVLTLWRLTPHHRGGLVTAWLTRRLALVGRLARLSGRRLLLPVLAIRRGSRMPGRRRCLVGRLLRRAGLSVWLSRLLASRIPRLLRVRLLRWGRLLGRWLLLVRRALLTLPWGTGRHGSLAWILRRPLLRAAWVGRRLPWRRTGRAARRRRAGRARGAVSGASRRDHR